MKTFRNWKRLANSLCKEAGGLDPGVGFRENFASPRGFYALEDLDVHVIYDNRPAYPAGIAVIVKKVLKAETIKVLAYSEHQSHYGANWVMIVDIPANMNWRCRGICGIAFKALLGCDTVFRDYNHESEEE